MFKALLFKEWREKASIAAFGLGLMAVFLAVFLAYGGDRTLREAVPAGFLIIFFPFIGLMLGAGAFESEFRNGAWAYLLSRPVRKEKIWLAKLVSLLGFLAVLWLVFVGLMAVVPGVGDVVAGFNFPETAHAGQKYFVLVLLSSFFYFSVAFSLSILSEKQLSLVLGSFFLAFILQGLMTFFAGGWTLFLRAAQFPLAFFAFIMGGRGMILQAGRPGWLDVYMVALILSSLAFLGASLITFRKADFSQPGRKAASLAKYSILLLALACLLAAAWPAVRPGPKEEVYSGTNIVDGEFFFSTTRGLYRYDIARDKLKKVVGWRTKDPRSVIAGGKALYVSGWEARKGPALRVVNTDGSGKRLLVKSDPPVNLLWFHDFILSPDGKTAAYVLEKPDVLAPTSFKKSLVSIRTDGSGSTMLSPLGSGVAGEGEEYSTIRVNAWLESSNSLLLTGYSRGGRTSLWTYSLATGAQTRLYETPRPGAYFVSPGRDFVIMYSLPDLAGPEEVSLLDIATRERSPVMTFENPQSSAHFAVRHPVWSRHGDKIAFFVQQAGGILAPAVYLLKERRLIMPRDVQVKGELNTSSLLGWTSGDAELVAGFPQERSLKVLGSDLAVRRSVPLPPSIGVNFMIWPADDAVLLLDFDKESVWRLVLKTEKWKKIW